VSGRRARALAVAALALGAFAGCQWGPIELPPPHGWREFRDPVLGVTLEIPDDYGILPVPEGISFFVPDVGTAAVLRPAATVDEERHHFAVGDTPLGTVMVAGRPAEHFRYRHFDGPIYCVTDAYVIPHGGRRIALEFRTIRGDAVKRHVLASMRFTGR